MNHPNCRCTVTYLKCIYCHTRGDFRQGVCVPCLAWEHCMLARVAWRAVRRSLWRAFVAWVRCE